ncbi:MAG: hypothetical protein JXA19_07065 [Anaerolineales bacterium]|nr:hypothetical protein [Anaerolineales bacterium]
MGNSIQTQKAIESAKNKLLTKLSPNLIYHSAFHTIDDVVPAVMTLGMMAGLSEYEMGILTTAAWYHDIGYIRSRVNHENHGVEIVRETLPAFGYSTEEIDTISGIIMATKMPQSPENLMQEIMADADLDNLGRDDFFEVSENLRKEQTIHGQVSPDLDWYRNQLRFVENHSYFTVYAKELRGKGKEKNIYALKQIIHELENNNSQ